MHDQHFGMDKFNNLASILGAAASGSFEKVQLLKKISL